MAKNKYENKIEGPNPTRPETNCQCGFFGPVEWDNKNMKFYIDCPNCGVVVLESASPKRKYLDF